MALVQFRDEVQGISETRRMHAPKKATIESWYKGARKVLPKIPPINGEYQIEHVFTSLKWIRWELTHKSTRSRCYVLIDREAPAAGN